MVNNKTQMGDWWLTPLCNNFFNNLVLLEQEKVPKSLEIIPHDAPIADGQTS